jgi:DUF2971 family protein
VRVFKYKPFNMHALDLLIRDELYLADAQTQLNDPVDCVLVYKGEHHPLRASVCALSEVNDNFAMWSQYADGHRGLCYELDHDAIMQKVEAVNSEVKERKLVLFGRVEYLDPAEFKIAVAEAVKEEFGESLVAEYEKIVHLKINTFSHEREVRIATKSLDMRKTLAVPDVVIGVYMGLNMPAKDREMLAAVVDMINKTRGRKIKKYSAKSVGEQYDVTFEAIG